MRTTYNRVCECCGVSFVAYHPNGKFCTINCKMNASYYRRSGRPIPEHLRIAPKVLQPEILDGPDELPLSWREAAQEPAAAPLAPFAYDGHQVRVITDEQGMPWFVATDVCAVLGVGNSRQALTRLDDDEKGVISNDTLGGTQSLSTVNESGLYSLILGSRKPEARAFKRWVTHDVLPSIRKTGHYAISGPADRQPSPAHLSPFRMEDLQSILSDDAPVTTRLVLPRLGLPVTLSNQMALAAALRRFGYAKRRVRTMDGLQWVFFPPNWNYSAKPSLSTPQPMQLPEGVHVVAATRRRAAELWWEAIQSEVAGALSRRLNPTHRADAALPLVMSYNFQQLSLAVRP
jgi:prophage antirepressor-like protein